MTDTGNRLQEALAGRYRIEGELGAGGMATVLLAHDEKHDRKVAIKVLHPDLGAALGADRFLAEIRTTARLQHPHILPLLDSGDAGAGLLYYVMPVATGETLRERLTRERQLPVDDALKIAREVADALGYAHEHGIVHRDIKPENILLQGGHALVADFGIALAVQQAGGQRMTQTGLSLGTPQYMSPEQAMGERVIDARSDLYALGAVLYEMLVGEPPFTGATLQAIVAKVVSAEPEPPSLVRKTVPAEVESAVLRVLAKLPADRFSTAAEFSAALTARADTGAARATSTERRFSRRAITVAASALLTMAGAGAGWLLARKGDTIPRAVPAVSASVMMPDSMRLMPQLGVAEGTTTVALSPDGSTLALVGARGIRSQLFVRSLSRFDVRAMEGTDGAQAPFFAFSGDAIYFFATNGISRVTLADGRVTRLHATPAGTFEGEAWGGTALPDGKIVISQRLATELQILSPNGDSVRTIACRTTCAFPAALPDGRHVITTSGDNLTVIDIETGSASQVTRTTASGKDVPVHGMMARIDRDGHLVYAGRDGRLYAAAFDSRRTRLSGPAVGIIDTVRIESGRGAAQFDLSASGALVYAPGAVMTRGFLVRADRAGKQDTIPVPADDYTGLDLSPDGRKLAARIGSLGDAKLEVIDVITGEVTPWLAGESIGAPSWTADGRRLAFVRSDSAFVADPEASAPPILLGDGTAILGAVMPLADTGSYLSMKLDTVSVVTPSGRVSGKLAMSPSAILTASGDGKWVIAQHLNGSTDGAILAYALDGSQRRIVIAPSQFGMPARAAGGGDLYAAVVVIGRSAGGEGRTLQTFYVIPYDASRPNPFGPPAELFTAEVADFPGRNYAVGMGGNRFVFKQHVASGPLREIRFLSSWHERLSAELAQ